MFIFETGSHVSQATSIQRMTLNLLILLSSAPKCWDCWHVPPYSCVVGDQIQAFMHARQTLCQLSPSTGRTFENGMQTGSVMSLSPHGQYFFCYHELSSFTEALSRNRRFSFPEKSLPTMGKVSLLPLVSPNSFNKWPLGACPLPGTRLHTRDSKLHKSQSFVVHILRKKTEVAMVQLETEGQDPPSCSPYCPHTSSGQAWQVGSCLVTGHLGSNWSLVNLLQVEAPRSTVDIKHRWTTMF